MEYQFSLAYLMVLNTPPNEMVHMAAEAGYDYVSLRPIYMGLKNEPNFSLATNPALFRATRQAMQARGIGLLDIELARIAKGVDVAEYEREIDMAAQLGGKHVLSSIWTDDRAYYLEQFDQLCEIAENYQMTVELEFVPIASVNNMSSAVDVIKSVKRENAGIMIDMHHFHRSNESVADLENLPKEWFKFAHLCDAPAAIPEDHEEMVRIVREARDYVGYGGIDIASIVQALPVIPYSIELPNKREWELLGYEQFIKKCLQTAQEYFDSHVKNGVI